MPRVKQKNSAMWQPRIRLPLRFFKVKAGRQAKRFNFSFYYLSLFISLRSFRTSASTRSKKAQHIYQPNLLGLREVCIETKWKTRRKKALLFPPARRFSGPAFITFLLLSTLFFGANLTKPVEVHPKAKAFSVTTPAAKPLALSPSQPTNIQIPRIAVDASVVAVGLDNAGAIAVPAPTVTGWYDKGPTPGEIGSSVIVGHLDWIDNIAVFWRLRELAPGDQLSVSRQDGSTATFKVDGVEEYPQASFPSQKVYGKINYAGLRLITCGGTFNTSTGHYSDNIVVYASLVK